MGSYVLYLLTQAFVALILAYFSGTLLFRERRLYMVLACAGFYLLMGSALMEVWGDKAGWTAWAVGANAALVATGVAAFGSGALLREAKGMEDADTMVKLVKVFLGISVVMGIVLATTGGTSDAIVGSEDLVTTEISGSFGHLGNAGWALGVPLLLGALMLSWLGMRAITLRKEIVGIWFVGGGVLFMIWPFDLWTADLPLSPSLFMMASALTYFGFQPPNEAEAGPTDAADGHKDKHKDGDRTEEGDEGTKSPAPWVMEAIASKEGYSDDGVGEDVEAGDDTGEPVADVTEEP